MSGAFKGSQQNWAIIEKEGFPIIEGVHRLKPFLLGREFRLFTDHRNLVYIFDPLSRSVPASRTCGDRLERWQLQLRSYSFSIEHITGEDNVWADIFTRWGAIPIDGTPAILQTSKKLGLVPFATYSIAEDLIGRHFFFVVAFNTFVQVCSTRNYARAERPLGEPLGHELNCSRYGPSL